MLKIKDIVGHPVNKTLQGMYKSQLRLDRKSIDFFQTWHNIPNISKRFKELVDNEFKT